MVIFSNFFKNALLKASKVLNYVSKKIKEVRTHIHACINLISDVVSGIANVFQKAYDNYPIYYAEVKE